MDILRWTMVVHQKTFIDEDGLAAVKSFRWLDRPEEEAYLFCFYWTLGVMRTMPVEVYPVNLSERIYVVFFMFFAVCVFSTCVSRIVAMWNKIHARRTAMNDSVAELKSYMKGLHLHKSVAERIVCYLEHKFGKRRLLEPERSLLNELSHRHLAELQVSRFGVTLSNAWIFKDLPQDEMTSIALVAQITDFSPGDLISQKGAVAQRAFFLVSGGLAADSSSQPRALTRSHSNSNVVQEPLVTVDINCLLFKTNTPSEKAIWVTEFSELIMIDKASFIQVRLNSPVLHQHLNRLRGTMEIKSFVKKYGVKETDEMHH